MFASGKTFTLPELIQAVDDIIANPAAKDDPALKDKLDWLFAHFAPDPDQKQLLLSYPQHLRAALQQTLNTRNLLALSDIKLSAPHQAYLRLHAARLGLSDTQTDWLISQQKQAAAAKAIDDLIAQGVTTPDSTQIQNQIQARINWDNRHTASLQRAVASADAHISRQFQQVLRPVIAQNPTIPRAQVAQAAYELAQTAYQTLKPQLPTIGSPQNLAAVLKAEIITPERLNQVATLQAFGFTPDQFSAAIDTASRTLFRRYLKTARANLRLLQMYGESDFNNVTATTPPPQIRPKTAAGFTDTLLHTYGYPGETLINAADPHAAENVIAAIPKKIISLVFSPVRLVIGNIETAFVSLAITHQKEQIQLWAVNRIFPLLPNHLQQNRDFDQIQAWVRSQVKALHEGRLAVDFDTREKLLEVNNNLNVLEFGLRYRQLLEKIPGVKGLLDTWSKFTARIPPVYAGYLRAWLNLAFRSDPLTAGYLLVEYGAIRPAVAGIWRAIVVPVTRHLPFGWDIKQGTFGMEAYWKPAKWAKDNLKQGLGWLAEKTGVRRAGEWVAQKIFKTTFAKLAAAFSGVFTGILIGWGFFKKGIKAAAGALFLFLITKGPWYATWGAAGFFAGFGAFGTLGALGGLALAPICGPLAPVCAPIFAGAGFMIVGTIGGLVTMVGALVNAWLLDTLWGSFAPWFTGSLLPGISQFLASLGHIGIPFGATGFAVGVSSIIGYQIYQNNLRNTAMMAPALGGGVYGNYTFEVHPLLPTDLGPGCTPNGDPFVGDNTYQTGYGFGSPDSDYASGVHPGIDIAGATDSVLSLFSCPVATCASSEGPLGNHVALVSGNIAVVYAHLNDIAIIDGQVVDPNTIIGTMGSTGHSSGPHLHLEIRSFDHPPTCQEALYVVPLEGVVDPAEFNINP